MAIPDQLKEGILSAAGDLLDNQRTPLSDLRSILVRDATKVDPSFDIAGVRTQTSTRPELLAAVPEFSGFEFDPTERSYIEDLYALYGGGVPARDVAMGDTAQIPGAIDTLVNVGGGGGMDQVTSGLDTTPQDFGQSLVDQGVGVQATPKDPVVAPGEMPLTQDDFDDFNKIAVTQPMTGGITGDPIDVGIPDIESGFVDPLGTISGAPVVSQQLQDQGPTTIEGPLSQVQVDGGLSAIETPEQQESFLQNVLGKAGQTVEGALNELGKVPGAVVDFVNQTVDVFGQKLNVGRTLASAAINKLGGGPISLVFDLLPQESLENQTSRSIVDELKEEKDYGFNITVGNLNVDPFGRSPVSGFGNYEQTLKEDALGINQTGFQTAEMREAKKEFAQDYFNKKAEKAGGVEVDEGTVLGPGEAPAAQKPTPTFESRGGEADRDPAPSAPAKTSQGVTTSQFQALRDPAPSRSVSTAGQAGPPSQRGGGGGGGSGGGGKIVCTMMNESYGFGSFRNKIWLRHSKDLAPEYQIGYHKIFLPLVRLSKKNIVLKKILEHIAVHRTIDIRQESRGKVHLLGRVYRKILEPICYWVGKHD